MSYILDALRRAEAERERGAVPGLHAQTVAGLPQAEGARSPMPPWIWLAAGGGIALAGVLAWTMLGSEPERPAPPAPAVATAPATVPIAPQSSLPPPIERPVAAPAPAPVVVARSEPPAVASSVPVVQTLPPPRPAAASEAAPRTYALSELPDDVRRQLPAINVGGAIHSPDPASRVLIINGQLFHEKDKITPDLTLLQIHLKEAVLQFRDYRVKIGF